VLAVADHYAHDPNRGWPGYHRAVALALIGDNSGAMACFQGVAADAHGSDIEWVRQMGRRAADYTSLANRNDDALRVAIVQQIAATRAGLRLPEIDDPFDRATTRF